MSGKVLSMNETGKSIQQLRKEAGYTQKSLATALHITTQAISKWERGLSLPDVALLPKLALLLDVDMSFLVTKSIIQDEWVGYLDIPDCSFEQIVYDKPLVYFLLMHYLLSGIQNIHVLTSGNNQQYLQKEQFKRLGFQFIFERPQNKNALIFNQPWFLFGSDLTRQIQGAMIYGKSTMLIPENQRPVAFCCRKDDLDCYVHDHDLFLERCTQRTLGRGMICFDMSDIDKVLDVAAFVRTYQKNSGLLIGSLEEIALKKRFLSVDEVIKIAENLPYKETLKNLTGKPAVV